jgi:hypothetical protein
LIISSTQLVWLFEVYFTAQKTKALITKKAEPGQIVNQRRERKLNSNFGSDQYAQFILAEMFTKKN